MVRSLHKSVIVQVAGVSLAVLLAGCSGDSKSKRQIEGNEDYLDSPGLQALNSPAGMILPVRNGEFDIPVASGSGPVGKALDIRPPTQALSTLSGSTTQATGDTASLTLNGVQSTGLWGQVVALLNKQGHSVASQDSAAQQLTTDWVTWSRKDEDKPFEARYQISLQQEGQRTTLVSRLMELRQNGESNRDPAEIQRYNLQMLNAISEGLENQRELANTQVDTHSLTVQNGSDETGLPLLIVRTSYNTLWKRLPGALQHLGIEIKDSSRSQGYMMIKYSEPEPQVWQELVVSDPKLPEGEYKLQLGDLENRSSVQFANPKGQVVSQAQNEALVTVLQAALNQSK